MSDGMAKAFLEEIFLVQPKSVMGLSLIDRNRIIISATKVNGTWVTISTYEEDSWWINGAPKNVQSAKRTLRFIKIPDRYRSIIKETTYRYMRRGRAGARRPGYASLQRYLRNVSFFTKYLESIGIYRLPDVSQLICANYHYNCSNQNFSDRTLHDRLAAVQSLYEFSQYTDEPITDEPWPGSSAIQLSGYSERNSGHSCKTPLIPDNEFSCLYQSAWKILEEADYLFTLRDVTSPLDALPKSRVTINRYKKELMENYGWYAGAHELNRQLLEVRTACYVIIASLSGCRNHEISNLKKNSYYCTEDDNNEKFWWMRSLSTKTGGGVTDWLIPEAAVKALRTIEKWAEPYQELLKEQIESFQLSTPVNTRIAQAKEHIDSVFLGRNSANNGQVGTLPLGQWNVALKRFKRNCGLVGGLATHQFRRTFANYVARSQFGDLRYLKEHYKHWSMDMTLSYALNEYQEIALYSEFQDELDDLKKAVVRNWLNPSTPLGGGYGNDLIDYRSSDEPITIFKNMKAMVQSIAQSTAIRSNGHAWCTSDNHDCPGNDSDPLRCGDGCPNGVVGLQHAPIYQGVFEELRLVSTLEDIGPGGRERMKRDLMRCRSVMVQLGHDPL